MKKILALVLAFSMIFAGAFVRTSADSDGSDLVLEAFDTSFDPAVMGPLENGYALPTYDLVEDGGDTGTALRVNWSPTESLRAYAHQFVPTADWSTTTFAQNAEKYAYLRFWISNPSFVPIQLTTRLFSDTTKVYMNGATATLTRKDGTMITHSYGNASAFGDGCSIEIPSAFSGWVAYPLRLDALTPSTGRTENLSSFAQVNTVQIDVRRPETSDSGTYYILDELVLSDQTQGKSQSYDGGVYDEIEGEPFETDLKNVIVLVGDGMGQTILQAARERKGSALSMDGMAYSSTKVVSDNVLDALTDSSAAGTALSCGVRTVNGNVCLDAEGNPVENMVEFFSRAGKKTGIVTTSYLLDATPVTYGSRGIRNSYATLAQGLFDNGISVLLGGGSNYMNTGISYGGQSQTLFDLAQNVYDYTYVSDASALRAYQGEKVLGVFGSNYMDYEQDRTAAQPSISEMTEKALELLENNDEGFFLMVEGGNIDHAAHANDFERTVTDTLAFDDAVQVALDYLAEHPDTLVVVCADHSTGGLVKSGDGYTFTTNDHDRSLTACFASGMGAENFNNVCENADIALAIRKTALDAAGNEGIKGDVDMNGVVDVADIMKLKDLIMKEKYDQTQLAAGDLNVSGKLDVGDIMGIKNLIMAA